MRADAISGEDIEGTLSLLRGGVREVVLDRAVAEVGGWQRRLEVSGREDLQPIAENLELLRYRLSEGMNGGTLDTRAIGELLTVLGKQVHSVAGEEEKSSVIERLEKLGDLLKREGYFVKGESQEDHCNTKNS